MGLWLWVVGDWSNTDEYNGTQTAAAMYLSNPIQSNPIQEEKHVQSLVQRRALLPVGNPL
jgi:hypothetical protein